MEKSKFFSYTGFHFKLCSLELRELFSFVLKSSNFANTVRQYCPNIEEFVPVYTCNRFDMCLFGEVSRKDAGELFYKLALDAMHLHFKHVPVCVNQLKAHILDSLRFEVDKDALLLFLRVASSLDSLVLGETQILGQLKKAYTKAKNLGFANKKASQIFDYCFQVSKRICNETNLFKNVISIGHLAVEMAQTEFSDIKSKNVIIFGAGEMALLTAKHFISHGIHRISIANRTYQNAKQLSQKLGLPNALTLSEALHCIADFDVCIVASGGDNLLLTPEHFKNYPRTRSQKAVFIDISVPRKIDSSLSELPNFKLINIDDLATIVDKNQEYRRDALKNADNIIIESVDKFFEKKSKHENMIDFRMFNGWLHDVIQKEVDRFLVLKTKNKDNASDSSIVARSVCKKVSSKLFNHDKNL